MPRSSRVRNDGDRRRSRHRAVSAATSPIQIVDVAKERRTPACSCAEAPVARKRGFSISADYLLADASEDEQPRAGVQRIVQARSARSQPGLQRGSVDEPPGDPFRVRRRQGREDASALAVDIDREQPRLRDRPFKRLRRRRFGRKGRKGYGSKQERSETNGHQSPSGLIPADHREGRRPCNLARTEEGRRRPNQRRPFSR